MSSEKATPDLPKPAPLPVPLHAARKALTAVESGANRVALIAQVEDLLAEWSRALGPPGHVALTGLARRERQLRALVEDFRERTFTRRDRQKAWLCYRAAWDEIAKRKEQASLAAKTYFKTRADEIVEVLKERGPRTAWDRLDKTQRERPRYLLSKQDADEVQKTLETVHAQIRAEAIRQDPVRLRIEERSRQARDFLNRVGRAADRMKTRITESRQQWENAANSLQAALLKQQIAQDEEELKQIQDKVTQVRKEVERLDKALESFQPSGSKT